MGSEAEEESSYMPKLRLLSVSHAQMQSPERPGTLTPPFYVSAASVPFRWEEEPGKPKPCTTLATFYSAPNEAAQKCLELPPRLLLDAKVTKLPSPTTVLEGPYMGRARFQSSSFRMGSECYGSFRSTASDSPEMLQLGTMVLSKRGYKEKGFLGSWRRRALKARPRTEVSGNSYVFASSGDEDREGEEDSSCSNSVKISRITRIGSFPTLSHSKSHFWGSIYDGLMQVVPWSKRGKKDRLLSSNPLEAVDILP
ncbi:maternal effect embryo arrest 47 [Hibiscus trionum]|uniref:Maternal effect embryo arrest 47 n=1 Tax=Hibiscus trionum TaxID=183268 RepID=A0A9W7GWV0_HIBTR|nr:maternal effect embryo arrest 47 [Hibiscus trionum]